ncbi:MAG: hypothetical protein EA355_06135 [Rhodobacteraceae bacterium]|nr:MAG: hypothetical protein EA355_06135 [Paracoccaceae bacterium]
MIEQWIYDPWAWLAVGVAMMLGELLLPGFLLLGFGLAAVVIAGVALFLPVEASVNGALLLVVCYAVLALGAWWALARRYGRTARRPEDGRDINDFTNR